MRTSIKAISVSTLLTASFFVAPAAFAADSTATAEVGVGSMTITATDVTLGAVTASHDATSSTGSVTVGVDDATGTGAGWNVTQKVSEFAYTGGNGGTAIPAANFSIVEVGSITHLEGVDTEATVTAGGPASLETERTVLSAAAGDGEGSYTAPVSVALQVPAGSRAGTYTAGLVTTTSPDITP